MKGPAGAAPAGGGEEAAAAKTAARAPKCSVTRSSLHAYMAAAAVVAVGTAYQRCYKIGIRRVLFAFLTLVNGLGCSTSPISSPVQHRPCLGPCACDGIVLILQVPLPRPFPVKCTCSVSALPNRAGLCIWQPARSKRNSCLYGCVALLKCRERHACPQVARPGASSRCVSITFYSCKSGLVRGVCNAPWPILLHQQGGGTAK